jgi:hypothetical protein
MAISCYLDESGTHSGSPEATVGGILLDKDNFIMFDVLWEEILLRHKIRPPLHMKEFGEHGRHGHLNYNERYKLFEDISKLINCYKAMSIVASLNHAQYKKIINPTIQEIMSIYSLCFMLCAHVIHINATNQKINYNIPYIVEKGNEYQQHILMAHNGMLRMQRENIHLHVGSLTFEDKNLSTLQAADVIAWSGRRIATRMLIEKGMEPLLDIFMDNHHINCSWEDRYLKEFSDRLVDHFKI